MVNDRFIHLLTKDLSDDLTDAEREEYILLLQENEIYRRQREILEDYWKRDRAQYAENAAMFKKVLDKIASDGEPLEEEQGPRQGRHRMIWYSAAAATLALVCLLAIHHSAPSKGAGQSLTTHWLEKNTRPRLKSIITLADGTVVTLNSATTLKYPEHFGDSVREVYLNGEAYFNVAKDPAHPFVIHANKMNVRVLGTAFNVKSYQSEPLSEATLINGSIEVTLNDRPSDRIILKPKEKLVIQSDSLSNANIISAPASVDSSLREHRGKGPRYALTNLTYFPNNAKTVVETSWVENKLVFSDQDFGQISGQLERWYGVHITFRNEKVKEYRFTGLFEKESLPEALNALGMIEHFHYKINGSDVYIY